MNAVYNVMIIKVLIILLRTSTTVIEVASNNVIMMVNIFSSRVHVKIVFQYLMAANIGKEIHNNVVLIVMKKGMHIISPKM